MNKLEIALNIMYKSVEAGNVLPTKSCFNIADEFEDVAVKRGLLIPEFCNKCGGKFEVIDLTTGGSRMFRVQCDCAKINADNPVEGMKKLWEKIND